MNASFQRIASITVCAIGLVLHASFATANCNVIPGANGSIRGALGSTDRPFAIPGDPVEIALAPGICDGETTAFVEQPGGATRADDYRVTLLFTLSQGVRNAVVVATDCSLLGAGSAPIGACNAQLGGGTATCVQAPAGNFAVSDALHLTFPFPDTDARVGAADDDRTLSGPVKIVVTPSSAALPCQFATQRCATGLSGIAACIDELYANDGTCRVGSTDIDTGFGHFVALPPPNSLESLATQAGTTEAHFTIDAAGNVLLPMDYQSVLVRIEGRPFPRITRGGSSIDAFTALAGNNVIDIPGRAFLSSWSPEGIRLPPVFEPLADPNSTSQATLFGTVDAPLGVIRIARRQPVLAKCVGGSNPGTPCDSASTCSSGGSCTSIVTPEYRMCTGGGNHPCLSNGDCGAATCGAAVCYVGASATATACTTDAQCTQPNARCGPSLFDFSDRSGPGPVVIAPGLYSADLEQPVTLEGTKETQSLLSFVVPEPIDGVSRNGDLDATDPVVVLRDRATGLVQDIGPGQTSEGRAVSTAYQAPFQFSAVAVEGDLVVFTEPEALQNNCPWALGCDQTGDLDTFDHHCASIVSVSRRPST